MPLEKSISFKTAKFDYKSELPSEYNAGNRFYGRDVAAHVCEQLVSRGFRSNFLDEDWGWLIIGDTESCVEFEIATYNINGHSQGGRPGTPFWGLWIRAFQRSKVFGLFAKRTQVPIPAPVLDAVYAAIALLDVIADDWTEGPG